MIAPFSTSRQRAVVIHVAVAEDQGVGAARIDLQRAVVVGEIQLGKREVEEDLPALGAAQRLEVVGEAVLGQQRVTAARERGSLHGDRVELATPGEDVVDVVDHVREDQPVDCGHRAGLRAGPPARRDDPAKREHAARDGAELEELSPLHGDLPARG